MKDEIAGIHKENSECGLCDAKLYGKITFWYSCGNGSSVLICAACWSSNRA
jgi:hypothetical protein